MDGAESSGAVTATAITEGSGGPASSELAVKGRYALKFGLERSEGYKIL